MIALCDAFNVLEHYVYGFRDVSLLPGDANHAYWQWQSEVMQRCIAMPLHHMPNRTLRTLVETVLEVHPPVANGCYHAAWCQAIHAGVDYVEGYMLGIIPIQHAWNADGDFHFDTMGTLEHIQKYSDARLQIIRLSSEEVQTLAGVCTGIGEFITDYYTNHIIPEKGKR